MPGLYLPDLSNIITVLDRYMEPSVRLARNKIGGETTVRGGIDNIEFFVFYAPDECREGNRWIGDSGILASGTPYIVR